METLNGQESKAIADRKSICPAKYSYCIEFSSECSYFYDNSCLCASKYISNHSALRSIISTECQFYDYCTELNCNKDFFSCGLYQYLRTIDDVISMENEQYGTRMVSSLSFDLKITRGKDKRLRYP